MTQVLVNFERFYFPETVHFFFGGRIYLLLEVLSALYLLIYVEGILTLKNLAFFIMIGNDKISLALGRSAGSFCVHQRYIFWRSSSPSSIFIFILTFVFSWVLFRRKLFLIFDDAKFIKGALPSVILALRVSIFVESNAFLYIFKF